MSIHSVIKKNIEPTAVIGSSLLDYALPSHVGPTSSYRQQVLRPYCSSLSSKLMDQRMEFKNCPTTLLVWR